MNIVPVKNFARDRKRSLFSRSKHPARTSYASRPGDIVSAAPTHPPTAAQRSERRLQLTLQPSSWNDSWCWFALNPRFDLFVDTVRAAPPPYMSCSRRRAGESSGALSTPNAFSSVASSTAGGEFLECKDPGAPNDEREDSSRGIQFANGSVFNAVLACD